MLHLILLCCVTALSVSAGDMPIPPPRPWEPDAFLPITEARIATLPAADQPAWRAYWQASATRARPAESPTDPVENTSRPLATNTPVPAVYSRGVRLDAPADWYRTEEARLIADHIAAWQTTAGGWSKGCDYTRAPKPDDDHHDAWSAGTFDNNSTVDELSYLARVISAGGGVARAQRWRDSFGRGLEYIFAAQFPHGGWPQIYPLAGSYHDAITFNDDAMVHILELLRDVAARKPSYAFVPTAHVTQARERLARGVACVLATQLRGPDRRRTVWSQQHDALTLRPCAARNFEPISECSSESAGLVLFLMSLPDPSAEVIAAVDGAVAWFPTRALQGVSWDRRATTGQGLVEQAAAPPLWARFYEFGTARPIFSDRDRLVHYTVTSISAERRLGYGWYNSRAAVLPALHTKWKAKLAAK